MESTKMIMMALLGVALLGAVVYTSTYSNKTQLQSSKITEEVMNAFKAWQVKYGKTYSDPDIAEYRLKIYNDNYNMILNHPKDSTYEVAENQFMDITRDEFIKTYLGLKPRQFVGRTMHVNNGENAAAVDWRTKGAVTGVKNQGQCGSCWAFSATGSMESADFIQKGTLGDFSEQQLVDCSTSYGNNGCNGGLMDNAFNYVKANGITTESAYPYAGVDQACKIQGGSFKISGFNDVAANNCADLTNAITQQPVSVAVDASNWQFYSKGTFGLCAKQLNHGVLAVGYNSDSTWIVKNSWGTSWGVQGYITLKKGNTCGLCKAASYPKAA